MKGGGCVVNSQSVEGADCNGPGEERWWVRDQQSQ